MFISVSLLLHTTFVLSQVASIGTAEAPPIRRHRRLARQVAKQDANRKAWNLADVYEGDTFFDAFDFLETSPDNPDPTHGMVNYLNAADAKSKGLATVRNNVAVLSVDNTTQLQPGQNRDSVRISTIKQYNGGLFIIDIKRMPASKCSYWPAYWSLGPDWPSGGEIDIVEGVNQNPTNQYTLHTAQGCFADPSVSVTSKMGPTTCESSGSDNIGCAFYDTDPRSYGTRLNDANGAVFVHLWDQSGITIWFFSRDDIPQDITSRKPNPSSWPAPAAKFPSDTCDTSKYFHDHSLVINTTLCGDWAGNAFQGCPGTCAETVADPSNFDEARWEIKYIAVYQSQ